jgi:hypothetical protein
MLLIFKCLTILLNQYNPSKMHKYFIKKLNTYLFTPVTAPYALGHFPLALFKLLIIYAYARSCGVSTIEYGGIQVSSCEETSILFLSKRQAPMHPTNHP